MRIEVLCWTEMHDEFPVMIDPDGVENYTDTSYQTILDGNPNVQTISGVRVKMKSGDGYFIRKTYDEVKEIFGD